MTVNVPIGYSQVTLHFSNPAYEGEAAVTFGVDVRTATGAPSGWPAFIAGAWTDTVGQRMSSAVLLTKVTMRLPTELGDQTLEAPWTGGGVLSGDLAPPNAAYLVQKRSIFAGKRNRGRFFIPGVLMSSLTASRSDLVASGPLAALQNELDLFLAEFSTISMVMVILHQEGLPEPPRPVIALTAVARLATQRGRLRD